MVGSRAVAWSAAIVAAAGAQPAGAVWLEARTGHFVVYTDSTEAALREYATRLERFDQGMRRLRRLPDRPEDRFNPLVVYVVPDVATVQRLCNGDSTTRDRAKCRNVYGFYRPDAARSVAFTPRVSGGRDPLALGAQTVLFHEYSHHFMLENYSAAYPAWFVEGFAEFNSTARFLSDGAIGFGEPALHRYGGLLMEAPLPLTTMLAADARPLTTVERESLYGRGWLLTHYLAFEKSRQGQLAKYLEAINAGTPSLDAAKTAFGDLGKLDRELDSYLHRSQLSYIALKASETPVGAVEIRALSAGAAAVMPARWRSNRGVDPTTAAAVAAEARRLAAPFANDPGAQDELAEAEFDAGNDAAAEAAADRALAADPADRTAMLYKGQVIARRAACARGAAEGPDGHAAASGMVAALDSVISLNGPAARLTDPARGAPTSGLGRAAPADPAPWRQARRWYVQANKLAPDSAEPLVLFYRSYLEQGIAPTANAVAGLERAFALAPQDPALRLLVVRQYLLDGRTADARSTLAPLAFDPHADADNPAKALLALIDGGQPAAAARLGDGGASD